MNISYEELVSDSKKIAESMLSSKEMVPSLFNVLGVLKVQFLIYVVFVVASFLFLGTNGRIDIWLGVAVFGILHWLFLLVYASGYVSLFSMLNQDVVKDLMLVRLISGKIKFYGGAWTVCVFILGLISVFTELNVAAIVFGNFIVSILGLIIFNIDVSRFQIPSLVGALAAAKDSLSKKI